MLESVSRMEKKEELGCHLRRGDGLGSMRKRVY